MSGERASGSGPNGGGRAHVAAAAVLLAEAIVIAVLVARGPTLLLPVSTSSGSTSFVVTQVDVGLGVIVPLALGALAHLLIASERGPAGAASGPLRWGERSLSASITVFLIAELNGIRELGMLVAIYALTSAMVLFGVLQERWTSSPRMLPAIFAAMIGIVPWGLIAWYEIAPAVVGGGGPTVWVRVLTVITLVLFLVAGAQAWRSSARSRASMVFGVVLRSALAWGVAAAIIGGVGGS